MPKNAFMLICYLQTKGHISVKHQMKLKYFHLSKCIGNVVCKMAAIWFRCQNDSGVIEMEHCMTASSLSDDTMGLLSDT